MSEKKKTIIYDVDSISKDLLNRQIAKAKLVRYVWN